MDRPDREKIAIQILKSLKKAIGFGDYKTGHWEAMTDRERQVYLEMADQIVALFPDIEELQNTIDELNKQQLEL